MKKLAYSLMLIVLLSISCTPKKNNMENPLLTEFSTPFGVPPFENILPEHYLPAFKEGMKDQKLIIQKIVDNTDKPSFENTIEAFENSSALLDQIGNVFYNITEAETNDELNEISKELAPIMSEHIDDIKLNEKLFSKIKIVAEQKETMNLTTEQLTLLDQTYQNFIRGGANLEDKDKDRFRAINKELSLLYLTFGDNILAENNRFEMVIDNKNDLDGLTETSINAAAKTATEKGYDGKWLFTIQKPSLLPFLENAKNRNLREKMYKGYIMKCDKNDSLDNKIIINKIVNLRTEKAQLLGYNTFAEFVLDRNMAKSPDKVYELLNQLMPAALRVAQKEVDDMQTIINEEDENFKIEPWDYSYYATKVKEKKYALNDNEIRQYLKLENVREGMFWVANQLYGISFTKLANLPIYNTDVEVFEVKESNGTHIGILYLDYFPRATKRSGAWCTSFRNQKYINSVRIAPIASIVCNFTSPSGGTPALLTVDETETLFHEFGHALDVLFSNKHYSSLTTPRDFVELPSQIMENWAFAPEVLNHYAKHYKTNETMPLALIEKIKNAAKFNQGFATTEYLAAAFLDMDYHTINSLTDINVTTFENLAMKKIQLIHEIDPRYRSTYFQHIFSSEGYAAGYYSYIWAEVLVADAFEAFKENGLFDNTTAASFRSNILELGGTEDAMKLYLKFRGSEPNIQPLIVNRGLN